MSDFSVSDYKSHDGLGLAALIRRKQVSKAAVFEAARAAIDADNPRLNAMCIDYEAQFASPAASASEAACFYGVPFLLKNQGAQAAGCLQTFGSRLYTDYRPDYDADIFTRFRAAGLLPLGRSNTPEMSLTPVTEPDLYGRTVNPWHSDLITGGSSGGAAAAVAAGLTPLAHATDGGGSIRQPAACCGVFGLKPSRARSPFGPKLGEGWNGLSTQLVVSRTVRDTAAALDAISAPSLGDPYAVPSPTQAYRALDKAHFKSLRILVSYDLGGEPTAPECRAAVADAAHLCARLGYDVTERDYRLEFEPARQIIQTIYGSHTAAGIAQRAADLGRPIASEELSAAARLLSHHGTTLSATDYVGAITAAHALGRQHAQMLQGFDVWLTPTMTVLPPRHGVQLQHLRTVDDYTDMIFNMMPITAFQNISGQPAMSMPLAWTETNIPIGCHFTAQFGREDILLQLAFELEKHQPWIDRYKSIDGR
ncbi:MAG: amidase [Pseudomonadota bacterium]